MNWKWALFSFRGRIRRSHYWYAQLALVLAMWLVLMASYTLLLEYYTPYRDEAEYLAYAFLLPFLWPYIATMVKRLHDHGRSGWFFFPLLIPYLGDALEMYFSLWPAGRGANKYGPDPLGDSLGNQSGDGPGDAAGLEN